MAKKRIGDIASAHDLNPKEVVKQLQEAGFSVQSPTSTIDERLALKVLRVGENGAGAEQKAEPAKPQQPRRVQPVGSQPRPQERRPPRQGAQGQQGGQRGQQGGPRGQGPRGVVIDSQAARRQGPGGPGGGPGGGPPGPQRRPPRRGGRRRRGTYDADKEFRPLDVDAQKATDLIRVNSGSTVKDVAEYLGVPVPEVIKKLMTLGAMATLTQP